MKCKKHNRAMVIDHTANEWICGDCLREEVLDLKKEIENNRCCSNGMFNTEHNCLKQPMANTTIQQKIKEFRQIFHCNNLNEWVIQPNPIVSQAPMFPKDIESWLSQALQEARQEGAKEERERIEKEVQKMIIKQNDEVLALEDHDERKVAGRHYRFMLGKHAAFVEFSELIASLSQEQTPKLDEKTQKIMDKINKKHHKAFQALADVEQTPEEKCKCVMLGGKMARVYDCPVHTETPEEKEQKCYCKCHGEHVQEFCSHCTIAHSGGEVEVKF